MYRYVLICVKHYVFFEAGCSCALERNTSKIPLCLLLSFKILIAAYLLNLLRGMLWEKRDGKQVGSVLLFLYYLYSLEATLATKMPSRLELRNCCLG